MKTLTGTVLSISKNLKSKYQRPSSSQSQIWAKLQSCIHNSIQMYQVAFISMENSHLGSDKYFWQFEVQRSRSPHDLIWTKYSFWIHNSIQELTWALNFYQYIWNLRFKDQKSWSQHDQIWKKYCFGSHDWIWWTEKRRLLEDNVWQKHTESTCGWRHPISASALSFYLVLVLKKSFTTHCS